MRLIGKKRDFVELHEVWLIKELRGKGYGKRFFEFFEQLISNKGYDLIVFYAYILLRLVFSSTRVSRSLWY